ncbi:MAG: Fe-S protein assembly chaperone HscA, partial [Pseudomonadota bacterium]
LNTNEQAAIDSAILDLQSVITTHNVSGIKSAIESLSGLTESFAARRMDKSVASALRGKTISEIAAIDTH